MTSDTDIEQKMAEIISEYKSGKDVTKDLVDIRSGGNYFAFHEWAVDRDLYYNWHFIIHVEDVLAEEAECVSEYFDEKDLSAELPGEKISNLNLDSHVNEETDGTYNFEIIDDVCVSIEMQWQSAKTMHLYNLEISDSFQCWIESFGKDKILYRGGECVNFSDDKLVKIWDSFVAKVRG